MIAAHVVTGPLPELGSDDGRRDDGSELIFHGRVRAEEHGRPIIALEYEHYPEMAEAQLRRVAEETAARFPIRDLFCWHRVGRIGVGETSLRVVIWSCHRAEGLEAMTFFVRRLKREVPIWKWAVTADGERFPSICSEEEEGEPHRSHNHE